MQSIMKALCCCWKSSWQGMVMAQLTYQAGKGNPSGYVVTVKEGRLVKVTARDAESGEEMTITLLPFRKGKQISAERPAGKSWHTFSAEEVHDFSTALGDHNGIHQGPHPIVSGFQLAETLQQNFPAASFSLRFHQPVYAGDNITVVEKQGILQGYTDGLCFVRKLSS